MFLPLRPPTSLLAAPSPPRPAPPSPCSPQKPRAPQFRRGLSLPDERVVRGQLRSLVSAYCFIPFRPLEGFRGYRGPQMTGGREGRKGRLGASAPQRVAWETSPSVSEVPGPDPPAASAGMGAPGSEGRPAATPPPDPRRLWRSWGRGRRVVPETRPSEHAPASVSPESGACFPHLPPPSSSGGLPAPLEVRKRRSRTGLSAVAAAEGRGAPNPPGVRALTVGRGRGVGGSGARGLWGSGDAALRTDSRDARHS